MAADAMHMRTNPAVRGLGIEIRRTTPVRIRHYVACRALAPEIIYLLPPDG